MEDNHSVRLRRTLPLVAVVVLALVAATSGGAAESGNVVGRVRVEQVFEKAGVVFFPSFVSLGRTRLITGARPKSTWPWVSVFIFRTAPEAQRLAAWHRTHPKVPLARNDARGGGERTLATKNLVIVWPAKSSAAFTAAVNDAYQSLLPHRPRAKKQK